MLWYLVRRFLQSVVVLWGVTIITFLIPTVFRGNIARQVLGQKATQALILKFNHEHKFDLPIYRQYWHYMWQLFHGDLGTSVAHETLGQSVTSMLGSGVWATIWIVIFAIVISLVIAIPLGLVQALKRNSFFDYAATGLVFILYSTPAFLLGILLIIFFSTKLHWFPFQIQTSNRTGPFGRLEDMLTNPRSFVLPVGVLVGLSVGGYSRFMRGSVLDVLVQDYVRSARAKGASSRRVLFRHALRNAIIPILTILGLSLPALFSGAIITESLFNIYGMGTIVVAATRAFDVNVVMGATLLIATATVTGNVLADLAVAAADPRVRLTAKK